jgi:raffinose/stachyose/melibiose transport system permease protein
MMRYVLLPGIRPTITLMMIMTVIWSFLAFDFVYILTQGGPAFSSEVLSTLAYRNAFYDLNVGQAAASRWSSASSAWSPPFFYVRIQQRRASNEQPRKPARWTSPMLVLAMFAFIALFPIALLVC